MPDSKVLAGFDGLCEICEFPFSPGARIKPANNGWVHTECWEHNHE